VDRADETAISMGPERASVSAQTVVLDGAPVRIEREVLQLAKFDGEKVDGDGKVPVEVQIVEYLPGQDDGTVLAHWMAADGGEPPDLKEYT
jgi:hypothetical protein